MPTTTCRSRWRSGGQRVDFGPQRRTQAPRCPIGDLRKPLAVPPFGASDNISWFDQEGKVCPRRRSVSRKRHAVH